MGRKPSDRVKLYLEKKERMNSSCNNGQSMSKKEKCKGKNLSRAAIISTRIKEMKKSYAPPIKEILREAGIEFTPQKRRKKRYRRKFYSTSDFKDAFVRPHPYNDIVTLNPILINPRQKKFSNKEDRRWRSFQLNGNFIAKCGYCGAIITSGFKSKDDYICSDCRFRKFSHCSVWTVRG